MAENGRLKLGGPLLIMAVLIVAVLVWVSAQCLGRGEQAESVVAGQVEPVEPAASTSWVGFPTPRLRRTVVSRIAPTASGDDYLGNELALVPMRAGTLADAYAANEVYAKENYDGRPILVTGLVTGVDEEFWGTGYLVHVGDVPLTSDIVCKVPRESKEMVLLLRVGDTVTLQGIVDHYGVYGSVWVDDCEAPATSQTGEPHAVATPETAASDAVAYSTARYVRLVCSPYFEGKVDALVVAIPPDGFRKLHDGLVLWVSAWRESVESGRFDPGAGDARLALDGRISYTVSGQHAISAGQALFGGAVFSLEDEQREALREGGCRVSERWGN